MIKLLLGTLITLTFIFGSTSKEIHVIYGLQKQELEIFKFFFDLQGGQYIDIGAYEPIMYSNTIYLYSRGWKGFNFEANPTRAAKFSAAKIRDMNFNYALGDQNKIVTLYEDKLDASQSTVSQNIAALRKQRMDKIEVSSISMKQICQRFITKKVNFLNLDVQGYGYKVLTSNDWNNTKCRPQIVILQYNSLSKMSKLGDPKVYIQSVGYKFFKNIGINYIFIEQQVYDYYTKKHVIGSKYLQKFQIETFHKVLQVLGPYFNQSQYNIDSRHIDNKYDPLYFYYPQQWDIINLLNINAESNKISEIQNRPIIIIQMNPQSNPIYLPNQKVIKTKTKIGKFDFFTFNITKDDNSNFMAYILDLKWENKSEIKYLYRDLIQPLTQTKQDVQQKVIQIPPTPQPIIQTQPTKQIQQTLQNDQFKEQMQMKIEIILLLQICIIISLIAAGIYCKLSTQKKYKRIEEIEGKMTEKSCGTIHDI